MFPQKTADPTLTTKVEREVDKIRDKIYQEAQKTGWHKYWENTRKKLAKEGYKLVSPQVAAP